MDVVARTTTTSVVVLALVIVLGVSCSKSPPSNSPDAVACRHYRDIAGAVEAGGRPESFSDGVQTLLDQVQRADPPIRAAAVRLAAAASSLAEKDPAEAENGPELGRLTTAEQAMESACSNVGL